MLFHAFELYDRELMATDGPVGRVKDFYFDEHWMIRYVVAARERWLGARTIMLSPDVFQPGAVGGNKLFINLSRQRVDEGPALGIGSSITRQNEAAYCRYHDLPEWWDPFGGEIGGNMNPRRATRPVAVTFNHSHRIFSARALARCSVEAAGVDLGRVTGLTIDDTNWTVRDLALDLGSGSASWEVLVPCTKVERISAAATQVFLKPSAHGREDSLGEELAAAGPDRNEGETFS